MKEKDTIRAGQEPPREAAREAAEEKRLLRRGGILDAAATRIDVAVDRFH